jgi:ADP-ribosyl-[dinitrogen reductase] hydrolase
MINKNDNMLLRIAQGDAYALCIEYVDREKNEDLFRKILKFESYLPHPSYHKLPPGFYTDDGQMSLSVAETLIKYGLNATSDDFLYGFLSCFKRDPRDGYSRKFQAILEQANSLEELKLLLNTESNRNGAAMRSVPLGVIKDPQDIIRIGKLQAATTHNTFNAKDSSVLVGLMSHYALYTNDSFKYINEWLTDYNYFDFKTPWTGPVHNKIDPKGLGVGINTVHAVNTLLILETSLMGMMRKIIEWGGDTDSVAAIAWGIGSTRYHDEVLPEFLETDLEPNGKYGVQYLKSLGKQLMDINI